MLNPSSVTGATVDLVVAYLDSQLQVITVILRAFNNMTCSIVNTIASICYNTIMVAAVMSSVMSCMVSTMMNYFSIMLVNMLRFVM